VRSSARRSCRIDGFRKDRTIGTGGLLTIDIHRGDYLDMKDARLVRFFKVAEPATTGALPDDVATHRRFTQ